MTKKQKEEKESLLKTLLNIPQRIEILGFYKGIPILHDPQNPAPDGMLYFINDKDFFEKEVTK